MHTQSLVLWVVGLSLACFACDSGSGGGGGAGTGAAGTSGAGTGAAGTEADAGSRLGPVAHVRVVNLVPDVTFDAWGPDVNSVPVRLAEGLAYGEISDYFDVPVNPISQDPIFVLWKSGDVPEEGKLFSMLQDNTHERMRIDMRELDGPGEHGTIVLMPDERSATSTLKFTTLDEVETTRGEPTQANLHISFHVMGLPDGAQPSVAVAGEACLFDGSTSIALAHSVPPGTFELAVYDTQSGADCSETTALASFPLEVAAGDNELVVLYVDDGEIKALSAPLAAAP